MELLLVLLDSLFFTLNGAVLLDELALGLKVLYISFEFEFIDIIHEPRQVLRLGLPFGNIFGIQDLMGELCPYSHSGEIESIGLDIGISN